MNIKHYLKTIKTRSIKTWLTISSIAIGIISVLIISSIGNAGKSLISNELDSLGVSGITIKSKDVSLLKLNNDHLNTVKRLNFVEKATPVLMSTGYLKNEISSNNVILWGISEENDQVLRLNLLSGRNFNNKDIKKKNNVCLLDENTAKTIFPETNIVTNRKIEVYVAGQTISYRIIGVVKSESGLLETAAGEFLPNIVYLPYTTLQNSIGNDELTQISVQVSAENDELDLYGNEILTTLNANKDSKNAISVENLTAQKTKLMGTLDIVSNSLTIIGIISLIVSGLGTMTVMLFSVSERTKEIGIKKSIGAKRGDIIIEFIIETLILSIIGAIIGILISLTIIYIVKIFFSINLTITSGQIISCILVSLVFGIVFGIYPAIKASKLNPVDALRRE